MKKKILAFLLAACLAMIPETAMEAQAAGEQGTDYRAPAYGTKAVAAEKQALYEEIEKATAALQPTADTVAPST